MILQRPSTYDASLPRTMRLPQPKSGPADDSIYISAPGNQHQFQTIPAAPRPAYVVLPDGNVQSMTTSTRPGNNFVDLTSPRGAHSSNLPTFGAGRFGYGDPAPYMDTAHATESIKALLQGAVEDDDEDDEEPATKKGDGKAANASDALVDALGTLTVKEPDDAKTASKSKKSKNEAEDEEDEEGLVEGLTVQLLPHQVEGLEWMTQKELGKRKKGVLPRGGILADDVSS